MGRSRPKDERKTAILAVDGGDPVIGAATRIRHGYAETGAATASVTATDTVTVMASDTDTDTDSEAGQYRYRKPSPITHGFKLKSRLSTRPLL